MMEYNTFKEVISERICDFLPPVFNDYYPVVESVSKINEKKDALTLRADNTNDKIAVPVLYLDEMYDIFKISEDLEDVLECAAEIIVNFAGVFQNTDSFMDVDLQKRNVVPNLINTEMNAELLNDVPHTTVLDMSVIYRVMIESPRGGFDSCVVNNRIMKDMGINLKELHELAMDNLKRVLPVEISRITRTDDLIYHPEIPDTFTFVSSRQRLFGASYMLSNDILKNLCRDIKCSKLYIIPFNINEICVTPGKDIFLDNLADILRQSNEEIDSRKEFLSNHIYCFDKKSGSLSKTAAYSIKKGLN